MSVSNRCIAAGDRISEYGNENRFRSGLSRLKGRKHHQQRDPDCACTQYQYRRRRAILDDLDARMLFRMQVVHQMFQGGIDPERGCIVGRIADGGGRILIRVNAHPENQCIGHLCNSVFVQPDNSSEY